ncbi:MAG: hypothetical protein HQM12_04120 [SAR324 cluster bacterium]|nr:hypothetical protein [SAR324 cluster bacterium]MBF0350352.1 hypothetical protein [SAR324 cluster bacterium]
MNKNHLMKYLLFAALTGLLCFLGWEFWQSGQAPESMQETARPVETTAKPQSDLSRPSAFPRSESSTVSAGKVIDDETDSPPTATSSAETETAQEDLLYGWGGEEEDEENNTDSGEGKQSREEQLVRQIQANLEVGETRMPSLSTPPERIFVPDEKAMKDKDEYLRQQTSAHQNALKKMQAAFEERIKTTKDNIEQAEKDGSRTFNEIEEAKESLTIMEAAQKKIQQANQRYPD